MMKKPPPPPRLATVSLTPTPQPLAAVIPTPHAPGSLDTSARSFRPVSMLMSDDLPTLLRPITANSGYRGAGQSATVTQLCMGNTKC
jgi:hypothetical protein